MPARHKAQSSRRLGRNGIAFETSIGSQAERHFVAGWNSSGNTGRHAKGNNVVGDTQEIGNARVRLLIQCDVDDIHNAQRRCSLSERQALGQRQQGGAGLVARVPNLVADRHAFNSDVRVPPQSIQGHHPYGCVLRKSLVGGLESVRAATGARVRARACAPGSAGLSCRCRNSKEN
jgi:hypothetical protein